MKKTYFSGTVLMLTILLALGSVQAQPMGRGYYGGPGPEGYGGWYCPWCGQPTGPGGYGGMGPGMMGPGYGMGPGMMGRGYGMGHGMMGPGMMHHGWGMGPQYGPSYGPQYGPQYQQPPEPMEETDAKEILENYLRSTRNPNLKLGKIEDKGSVFEAEIVTKKEGALVDKVAVDKYTGWMRSVY